MRHGGGYSEAPLGMGEEAAPKFSVRGTDFLLVCPPSQAIVPASWLLQGIGEKQDME